MLNWWHSLRKKYQVSLIVAVLSIFGSSWFYIDEIHIGDKISNNYEYNQEELINLANELAQKYRELDAETIKELERTVIALSQQDAGKYDVDEALNLLSQGRTEEAEKIFELVALEARRTGQKANQKEAAALRHIGTLAYLDSTQNALEAYKRSTELEPNNAIGWNQLGHLYMRIGELDKADDAFRIVLRLARTNREYQAIAYGNLGLVYQTRGDLDKAVAFYENVLAISQELGNKENMAKVYGNLGIVYEIRDDLDKAVSFYEKSLAINQELGRKEGVADQYGNLGIVYRIRGDLDMAARSHEKSLVINQKLGRKEGMANQYANLGLVYQIRGDLSKAAAFHEKALAMNHELIRKEGMADQYANLGLVYQIRGDFDSAVKYWEQSLALFTEMGAARKIEQTEFQLDNIR